MSRFLRPLAFGVIGALIAVGVYVLVDGSSSSSDTRATQAAPSSTPTTTNQSTVGEKVYRVIQPSLVLIETEGGPNSEGAIGSGVVVNAAGQIMTAEHVIDGASAIRITFADGSQVSASVVSSTPENDIAVLQPDSPPGLIVPAVLGGGAQIGDETFSVGNPLGLTGSLTAGVVSGLDRTIERENGAGDLDGLIQFDAAVNPGSSGGPLVNRDGEVVGIVTGLVNPTGQPAFSGVGFAVTIDTAASALGVPPD
jgi:S1-C subfamily serine protease